MRAALEENGGVWFGWSGRCNQEKPEGLQHQEDGGIAYVTTDLSKSEHDAYYSGFSNRSLWPLLHSRLDLLQYSRAEHTAYLQVNARFADRLMSQLRDDDVVWVHDYHLIPFARLLRARGFMGRIGFFLHVPVPPPDLLATLPGHAQLFGALADYDLVGLQTLADVQRLHDYMQALRKGTTDDDAGMGLRAEAFPISIDTALVAQQAEDAVGRKTVRELRDSLGEHRLAIGVDRLDYSKGLPRKFESFARYLDNVRTATLDADAPPLTFLQIAPPSRSDVSEYRALRRELETLTGGINSVHALPAWTPVRYVNRSYRQDVVAGFYRVASVGLVTPLRDGMNLVAKEYVAAQDPDDPGVLVLSRYAGAAAELGQALLVNPYDIDDVAGAIQAAADMPLPERRRRHAAMLDTLRRNDIHVWRRSFLQALRDR